MTNATLGNLRLLSDVVRLEGFAAARDRVLDRLERWQRLRGLAPVDEGASLEPKHREPPLALNVSPLPPFPRRGGAQLQMLHRLGSVSQTHAVGLLYPIAAKGWRLEWIDGPRRARVDLMHTAAAVEAIERAAGLVGANTVHIENLSGLPTDLPSNLQHHGLDVVLSVHDFSLYCRRPHLMERPAARFCGYSSDDKRCLSCLRCDWQVDDDLPRFHREQSSETLASSRAVVFPSSFARDQHECLFPSAASSWNPRVIAPATRKPIPSALAGRGADHIAFVGGLQLHKGALLVPQVVEHLASGRQSARSTMYGGGDLNVARGLARTPGLRVRGYYRAGALPRLLRQDRVSVAVMPSIWPETYGLVVDECLSIGVPVVIFDLGAPADRLRGKSYGEVVPAHAGAPGLADAIECRLQRRIPLEEKPNLPTPEGAAKDHLELYRLLESA